MPFPWSPAVLDDLHRLYVNERRSAAETARALGGGVSRHAVLGKVQRLGWTRAASPRAGRPAAEPADPRAPARRRLRPGGPFARALPLPRLREAAVAGAPRLWTERMAGQCAFPVGEPAAPGQQLSCCAPAGGGGAYCPAHRALMTQGGAALTPQEQDAVARIAGRAA